MCDKQKMDDISYIPYFNDTNLSWSLLEMTNLKFKRY